jgi:hypothetical protein
MIFDVRRIAVVASLLAAAACRGRTAGEPIAVVPFDSMISAATTVALGSSPDDSLVRPSSALISKTEIVVVDPGRPDVRVFRRLDGSLARTIAAAGDEPGAVRRPSSVAALDSGRFVILDHGRHVLSFRDSLGAVVRETPMVPGFLNSMLSLPGEQRLVFAGDVLRPKGDAKGRDIHEISYDGQVVASYAKTARISSEWERRFKTLFATRVGSTIATGSVSSNRIRFVDRQTGKARSIEVASGWYQPLDWPADRELTGGTAQSVAERVTAWGRKQRIMNGIFPLGGDRLLARFMAFDPTGERVYYYAVADTAGKTYAVTEATRSYVVATAGDTLYWLARRPGATSELGVAVLGATPNAVAAR